MESCGSPRVIHLESWYKEATSDPVTLAILKVRQDFIDRGAVECLFDIGSGFCEELVGEVEEKLGMPDHIYGVWPQQFALNNKDPWGPWDFDRDLLSRYWGITSPPAGWTWEEISQVPFGGHIFLVDRKKNRFYDAEAPEGVKSFLGLPFFQRYLEAYGPKIRGTGVEDEKVWERARQKYLKQGYESYVEAHRE